ncbi:35876_t:CDS:2 [Gigaspora margarita]|uniref:35876_t:CDS:1 n=1 Tax=Gigaspora margarita TaxID=4874 RepID=A0ABN7VY61_GIGMA|nr:35876_t:CDS:2 [Gigaspora margarita]
MSAITTKFVIDHELTNEMSLEELSQYAPEILELLTDDKEKRHQAHNRLLNGYKFSKEQVFALIPLQRVGRYKSQVLVLEKSGLEAKEVNICQVSDSTCTEETIKEMAQHIVRDKLSKRDIKAISRALVKTAPILSSNKIQKEYSKKRKNEGIDFPDHFLLESVKERLDLYDVSNTPDKQALADVMIMLSIRPAEIKNLYITNRGVTGYAKNQDQQDISPGKEIAYMDPGKLGSIYLSTFLKKDEFFSKPYKPLLPSSLRKLGSVFASVVHSAKNLSEANTFASEALRHSNLSSSLRKLGAVFASIAHGSKNASKANTYASEALRHSPDNYASPSKRYTIVNMRKRGELYN